MWSWLTSEPPRRMSDDKQEEPDPSHEDGNGCCVGENPGSELGERLHETAANPAVNTRKPRKARGQEERVIGRPFQIRIMGLRQVMHRSPWALVRHAASLFGERIELARNTHLVDAGIERDIFVRGGCVLDESGRVFEDGVEDLHPLRHVLGPLHDSDARLVPEAVVVAAFRMADDEQPFFGSHRSQVVRERLDATDVHFALGSDEFEGLHGLVLSVAVVLFWPRLIREMWDWPTP